MEGDVITLQEVFRFDHSMGFDDNGRSLGELKPTGLRPKFVDKLATSGISVDIATFVSATLGP
jgi:pilus assembly protein CpaF